MEDRDVPQAMRRSLRTYFHESRTVRRREHEGTIMKEMSPMLQGEVVVWMYKSMIERIDYLKNLEPDVVVSLALHLGSSVFAPQEQIALHRTLFMVQRGIAARNGRVLTPGDHWGADMILNDKTLVDRSWARSLGHLEVLTLSRHGLDSCTEKFPAFATRIRWTVIRLTFMRKVIRVSEVLRRIADFAVLPDETRLQIINHSFQTGVADPTDPIEQNEENEPTMTQLGHSLAQLKDSMAAQTQALAAVMEEVRSMREAGLQSETASAPPSASPEESPRTAAASPTSSEKGVPARSSKVSMPRMLVGRKSS
eukprot:gnl/TRDRNA2_/TRDRNA2_142713_c3_seq1.p1 gnl/TRDRNA2_/TRDRNA2_142713_c3~~gnl/TRDRNA2_/TRDRNA2_142713_c3_seq1.p1  ORF type:complete len:310 (-),score=39.43 gnl/TRDRNA2_/TRDRNA2_142713_c3_seq1:54-983(-)